MNLRLSKLIKRICNEYTLIEIVEMLDKNKIEILGNISNTSKKDILTRSLKSASNSAVENLLNDLNEEVVTIDKTELISVELHPNFDGTKVEKFLTIGEYEEAIRIAYLRIVKRVKNMSGLNMDGVVLMRSAFSKNNPILKVNNLGTQEDLDEQEGIMHIFEGSILAFRNPHSHDDEKKLSLDEAKKIMSLANYLMILLDKIENRSTIQ